MKLRGLSKGRFRRLVEETYNEFRMELKKPPPRKPTRGRLVSEFVVFLFVYFLIVGMIWWAMDTAFQLPELRGNVQTFQEEMTIGNLTFGLYVEVRTECTYMAAGCGIDARVGMMPRNFSTDTSFNYTTSIYSHYAYDATFPNSHEDREGYYNPWEEGWCPISPREANESSYSVWERVSLYGECGIYYQIPGDFPVRIHIERIYINVSSASHVSELIGNGVTEHVLRVSPQESWVQDFDAQIIRNMTLAVFILAITSIAIQLWSFMHSATKEMASIAEEQRTQTDKEIDEEVGDDFSGESLEKGQKQP